MYFILSNNLLKIQNNRQERGMFPVPQQQRNIFASISAQREHFPQTETHIVFAL